MGRAVGRAGSTFHHTGTIGDTVSFRVISLDRDVIEGKTRDSSLLELINRVDE